LTRAVPATAAVAATATPALTAATGEVTVDTASDVVVVEAAVVAPFVAVGGGCWITKEDAGKAQQHRWKSQQRCSIRRSAIFLFEGVQLAQVQVQCSGGTMTVPLTIVRSKQTSREMDEPNE
jgi:hypothetical protein